MTHIVPRLIRFGHQAPPPKPEPGPNPEETFGQETQRGLEEWSHAFKSVFAPRWGGKLPNPSGLVHDLARLAKDQTREPYRKDDLVKAKLRLMQRYNAANLDADAINRLYGALNRERASGKLSDSEFIQTLLMTGLMDEHPETASVERGKAVETLDRLILGDGVGEIQPLRVSEGGPWDVLDGVSPVEAYRAVSRAVPPGTPNAEHLATFIAHLIVGQDSLYRLFSTEPKPKVATLLGLDRVEGYEKAGLATPTQRRRLQLIGVALLGSGDAREAVLKELKPGQGYSGNDRYDEVLGSPEWQRRLHAAPLLALYTHFSLAKQSLSSNREGAPATTGETQALEGAQNDLAPFMIEHLETRQDLEHLGRLLQAAPVDDLFRHVFSHGAHSEVRMFRFDEVFSHLRAKSENSNWLHNFNSGFDWENGRIRNVLEFHRFHNEGPNPLPKEQDPPGLNAWQCDTYKPLAGFARELLVRNGDPGFFVLQTKEPQRLLADLTREMDGQTPFAQAYRVEKKRSVFTIRQQSNYIDLVNHFFNRPYDYEPENVVVMVDSTDPLLVKYTWEKIYAMTESGGRLPQGSNLVVIEDPDSYQKNLPKFRTWRDKVVEGHRAFSLNMVEQGAP